MGTGDNGAAAKGSVERLGAVLDRFGLDLEIKRFPASTRTAEDAAAAIGCTVAQIAKSIVFRGAETDRVVLVVTSGTNRVDEKKVAAAIGEPPGRADAAFVRERTGFAIGGVAPVGHRETPVVLLDRDLRAHAEIWAAAGAPDAVFRLTPDQLAALTDADWHDIRRA
ncbi:YbaK/EbsC family protein [Marivibrio halodurans]|uniref:YbaK/EbsC family protein n=2 Tax=Marivibrio halodurans TaxID=2039722 RepID=A0A8J7V4A1_9PROT|nr:YbaK/EbsC family protein [Marivibrio halodurans]